MNDNYLVTPIKKQKKVIAIILAILFGPLTWIYTIKQNSLKAAIALAINISSVVLIISFYLGASWQEQEAAKIPGAMIATDSGPLMGLALSVLFCSFIWISIWIWAIVDASLMKQSDNTSVANNINTLYSMILSITIGPWTWFYTYSKDWWKFLIAVIAGYASLFVGFGGLNYVLNRDLGWDSRLGLIVFLCIWVLAIALSVIRFLRYRQNMTLQLTLNVSKNRTTSVLLAVFFYGFTWLYTFKKDAWKFWISLILTLTVIVMQVFPNEVNNILFWIISSGLWLWALLDTIMKKNSWYENYGIQ